MLAILILFIDYETSNNKRDIKTEFLQDQQRVIISTKPEFVILTLGICIIVVVSCVVMCCSCDGSDLLPTIPDNSVCVTENPAARRTQLQQDSIISTSAPTQPPGNPNRVTHFNSTTPREDTTETTGVITPGEDTTSGEETTYTTGVIITSGPPRYPYSAAELASWESPDISPPQDAPPPSYDDLFESSTYDLILN